MLRTIALLLLLALTLTPAQSQEPASTPQAPVHVSGGEMAGRILTKGTPVFPDIPPGAHVAGATVLHAIIGKDGHVKSLSVISGPAAVRGLAMDAVKEWTYRPYLLNGEPVEVDTTVTLNIDFGAPSSQAPAPATQEPVRVSGGVMAGTILTKVQPVMPCEALKQHVSGAVVMHVIIGKDGHIKEISVISGPQLLRAAFVDAVRQWTYKPYLLNGTPVEVDTTITVTINMGGGPYPQCP